MAKGFDDGPLFSRGCSLGLRVCFHCSAGDGTIGSSDGAVLSCGRGLEGRRLRSRRGQVFPLAGIQGRQLKRLLSEILRRRHRLFRSQMRLPGSARRLGELSVSVRAAVPERQRRLRFRCRRRARQQCRQVRRPRAAADLRARDDTGARRMRTCPTKISGWWIRGRSRHHRLFRRGFANIPVQGLSGSAAVTNAVTDDGVQSRYSHSSN
jgi:hypothetical protein